MSVGDGIFRTRAWLGRGLGLGLGLALCLSLGACVVNEPETPARGVVVTGPPPAPVHEERPASPGPQSVWVGGYWHWTGMQYAWIPGHWDAPPPGSVWSAPVYTAQDGKYFYQTGGWNNAPSNASPPPQSPPPQNALR